MLCRHNQKEVVSVHYMKVYIMPLYTIFKDLVFQSLCLVPNNIDSVLSCLKCMLNFFLPNHLQKLEKAQNSCYSFSIFEGYTSIISVK